MWILAIVLEVAVECRELMIPQCFMLATKSISLHPVAHATGMLATTQFPFH